MSRLARIASRLRRGVLRRRRPLAAAAAGAAVFLALQATADPPPPTATVLTAARDLPAGIVLSAGDLSSAQLPVESVPAGVVVEPAAAVGRTTASPLRSGEPLTDVRLVSGSLLGGYPGRVAAPVRLTDPGAVALLRIGDRVDVLAADAQAPQEAYVVADDAPVIALPRSGDGGPAGVSGALVVLAVTDGTARALAAASVASYLSLTIEG